MGSQHSHSETEVRLDNLYSQDIDLKTRSLFLIDEVETDSISRLVKGLKFLEGKGSDPIYMYVNSPGGSLDQMFFLYDAYRASKCPIVTIGTGSICSAAGLILCAGDYRIATENAYFMAHEISSFLSGNAGEIDSQAAVTKKLRNRFWDTMARHTKKTASSWKKGIQGREIWYDATEMLKFGIIDHILSGKETAEEIYNKYGNKNSKRQIKR